MNDYYLYHLTMFLFYNARSIKQDWKNDTAKKVVLFAETHHAHMALVHMPATTISEIATLAGVRLNDVNCVTKGNN